MKATLGGTVLLVILGCTDPTGPIPGSLWVQAIPPALQLTNQSPAPVYSFVIESQTAALVNWAPCADPSRCSGLAPGGSLHLPYTDIAGYTPGARQAIVYWWHLVPSDGPGFRTDSIRAVMIGL